MEDLDLPYIHTGLINIQDKKCIMLFTLSCLTFGSDYLKFNIHFLSMIILSLSPANTKSNCNKGSKTIQKKKLNKVIFHQFVKITSFRYWHLRNYAIQYNICIS